MGFDEGHFAFDSPNLTYYTGQIVFGKLVFNQDKVKTFRGLYVKVKGYCHVHWTTSHSRTVNGRTERHTTNHNSHETYFENKIYLIGGKDGEVHLNPGHHEYPFQCQIPIQCPSSFEGGNGYVRYEVKAVVDRAFKFDQEKHATLTVIAAKDLNADPYCKEPMIFNFEESYCCWCMWSGPCEVTARLPQSGYCPGQTINIELNCNNRSNVEIDKIKFEIKKTIHFHATNAPGNRYDKDVVAKLVKGPVPANTSRTWALEMEIPQMDVYNTDACSYIDIYYTFEVEMVPSGCHSNESISYKLVIGTIPLRELDTNVPLAEYPNARPLETNQTFSSPNQAYPLPNQQYPAVNPYPPGNSPYPGGNQPFPTPYPTSSPYPGGNLPYPGGNQPSPFGNQPYPGGNHPYPGGNQPYAGGNQPNPGGSQTYLGPSSGAPYPNVTPTPGFQAAGHNNKEDTMVPLLPVTAAVPYPPMPSPYAAASAPEPSTPDFAGDKMPVPTSPAHNPSKNDNQ